MNAGNGPREKVKLGANLKSLTSFENVKINHYYLLHLLILWANKKNKEFQLFQNISKSTTDNCVFFSDQFSYYQADTNQTRSMGTKSSIIVQPVRLGLRAKRTVSSLTPRPSRTGRLIIRPSVWRRPSALIDALITYPPPDLTPPLHTACEPQQRWDCRMFRVARVGVFVCSGFFLLMMVWK